ncbi:CD59 glycoprotein-like [Syngnathus typhle]|uniref:CD59 glycoprotein-like n=1 Tax=Syngnathus typhle TaxID=161592 RepID=UPI002A6B57D3|nr:CD59 glycoprotein-like [Syngnathus typhle]XP_061138347.1 CD59 glycoprotein-like [Syngnathus typhle]
MSGQSIFQSHQWRTLLNRPLCVFARPDVTVFLCPDVCVCGKIRTKAHYGHVVCVYASSLCGLRVEWIVAEDDDMSPRADPVLVLMILMALVHASGALRCYKCSDYTGRCENVHECTYEDACLTLSVQGGKTLRQCIRYTDCDNSRLSQMFPAMSPFSYRCCNNNLCNSSGAPAATPLGSPLLIGWLLSALVFWL